MNPHLMSGEVVMPTLLTVDDGFHEVDAFERLVEAGLRCGEMMALDDQSVANYHVNLSVPRPPADGEHR